jgi:phosphoserine phosphatase
MFGDGATDMQARPPAEAFIGYGGVVVRDAVKIGADWFIMDFSEIISELES